jgi:hypothetical protein
MTTIETKAKENTAEALNKIKAIQNLNRHSESEVVNWVLEALDFQYPAEYKMAFEEVTKKSWSTIRDEIIQVVKSQDYEKIHVFAEGMLSSSLLNLEVSKKIKKPTGNLAVFYDKPDFRLFVALSIANKEARDPKIESYILYRHLCGKPRLSNGFLSKI